MRRPCFVWMLSLVAAAVVCAGGQQVWAAGDYAYDLVHSSVSFKARHLDISWIHGRFKGMKRVGFSTELALKRSDFGFDKNAIGLIGDEALILIDCEGVR